MAELQVDVVWLEGDCVGPVPAAQEELEPRLEVNPFSFRPAVDHFARSLNT